MTSLSVTVRKNSERVSPHRIVFETGMGDTSEFVIVELSTPQHDGAVAVSIDSSARRRGYNQDGIDGLRHWTAAATRLQQQSAAA